MVSVDSNDRPLRELALFAGIGGGILGSKLLGHRIMCAVEIEPYCREVLLRRQEEGILEPFPIWDDVRTFDGTAWRGKVDIVSGGFPCQPFSVAGKQRGEADERNMFPDTIRIISEVRPRIAWLENVPGLLNHEYMRTILGEITELGYDCRWGIVGADDVRAPHRRKRWWCYLSDTERVHRERVGFSGIHDYGGRREGVGRKSWLKFLLADGDVAPSKWESERYGIDSQPNLVGGKDGFPYGLDRLRGCGNGQVPAVVRRAWELLSEEIK